MTELGTDLSLGDDLDPLFSLVSGRAALIQSIRRRLFSDTGSLTALSGDPSFGFNLFGLLNMDFSPSELQAWRLRIRQQALLDERVRACEVTATHTQDRVTFSLQLLDSTGPFRLVVTVDAVAGTISLLES